MVVKCAKCIEFIFLCSTTTSSSRYAILPLDQDTLMWISMIFMQMTPAYNDCTVDTLHKSVSVRQLSAEPKPLLPSKEPGICHRFNCCCCWERGGEVPASFRFPQKLDWSGLWLKVGLICKIGSQSEAVAERNPWNPGNPYYPLSVPSNQLRPNLLQQAMENAQIWQNFSHLSNLYLRQIMMWSYLTTGRTAPEVPFQSGQLLHTLPSYWSTACKADQSKANTLFTFTSKVEVSFGRGVGGKRAHDQRKMYHFDEGGKLGGWLVKNKLIGGTGWHGCY